MGLQQILKNLGPAYMTHITVCKLYIISHNKSYVALFDAYIIGLDSLLGSIISFFFGHIVSKWLHNQLS